MKTHNTLSRSANPQRPHSPGGHRIRSSTVPKSLLPKIVAHIILSSAKPCSSEVLRFAPPRLRRSPRHWIRSSRSAWILRAPSGQAGYPKSFSHLHTIAIGEFPVGSASFEAKSAEIPCERAEHEQHGRPFPEQRTLSADSLPHPGVVMPKGITLLTACLPPATLRRDPSGLRSAYPQPPHRDSGE